MKHTCFYCVNVNNYDHIITLYKPLEDSIFRKDPHAYCESEDTKTRALIHYSLYREEHYFRNLTDAKRYFNKLRKSKFHTEWIFNDVLDEM